MRSLIVCLMAVLLCVAAIVAASRADAAPFSLAFHRPNGQCDNGQCDNGQCDNGQGDNGQCERGKHADGTSHLRKKIDVDVDVDVTNPAPAPETKPGAKPAGSAELNDGEKAALVVCTFLLVGGIAAVVQFKKRVAGKSKS
jgi:hypothetical protein